MALAPTQSDQLFLDHIGISILEFLRMLIILYREIIEHDHVISCDPARAGNCTNSHVWPAFQILRIPKGSWLVELAGGLGCWRSWSLEESEDHR